MPYKFLGGNRGCSEGLRRVRELTIRDEAKCIFILTAETSLDPVLLDLDNSIMHTIQLQVSIWSFSGKDLGSSCLDGVGGWITAAGQDQLDPTVVKCQDSASTI